MKQNNSNIISFEPVISSQIKARGHKDNTLYLIFRNGKTYSYSPVTKEQYKEFKDAESAGAYFHTHFKMNSKLLIKQEDKLNK